MKPLQSYAEVRAPKKPKERKGVKKYNAQRHGRKFPKNVDEGLRMFARRSRCLIAGAPRHICRYTEKRDPQTGGWFYGSDAAHVNGTQGAGVKDWDHIIPLCRRAHDEQQGRTRAFEYHYGIKLKAAARRFTTMYFKACKAQ